MYSTILTQPVTCSMNNILESILKNLSDPTMLKIQLKFITDDIRILMEEISELEKTINFKNKILENLRKRPGIVAALLQPTVPL